MERSQNHRHTGDAEDQESGQMYLRCFIRSASPLQGAAVREEAVKKVSVCLLAVKTDRRMARGSCVENMNMCECTPVCIVAAHDMMCTCSQARSPAMQK